MSFYESYVKAKQRGASDEQIVNEIYRQNQGKPVAESIKKAFARGASATQILNEIYKQNLSKELMRRGDAEGARYAALANQGFGGDKLIGAKSTMGKLFEGAASEYVRLGAGISRISRAITRQIPFVGEKIVEDAEKALPSNILRSISSGEDKIMQDDSLAFKTGQFIGAASQFLPAGGSTAAGMAKTATEKLARILGKGAGAKKLAKYASYPAVEGALSASIEALRQGEVNKEVGYAGAIGAGTIPALSALRTVARPIGSAAKKTASSPVKWALGERKYGILQEGLKNKHVLRFIKGKDNINKVSDDLANAMQRVKDYVSDKYKMYEAQIKPKEVDGEAIVKRYNEYIRNKYNIPKNIEPGSEDWWKAISRQASEKELKDLMKTESFFARYITREGGEKLLNTDVHAARKAWDKNMKSALKEDAELYKSVRKILNDVIDESDEVFKKRREMVYGYLSRLEKSAAELFGRKDVKDVLKSPGRLMAGRIRQIARNIDDPQQYEKAINLARDIDVAYKKITGKSLNLVERMRAYKAYDDYQKAFKLPGLSGVESIVRSVVLPVQHAIVRVPIELKEMMRGVKIEYKTSKRYKDIAKKAKNIAPAVRDFWKAYSSGNKKAMRSALKKLEAVDKDVVEIIKDDVIMRPLDFDDRIGVNKFRIQQSNYKYMFVSAENPMGKMLPAEKNAKLTEAFKKKLDEIGVQYKPIKGMYGGNKENSFIVILRNKKDANEIHKWLMENSPQNEYIFVHKGKAYRMTSDAEEQFEVDLTEHNIMLDEGVTDNYSEVDGIKYSFPLYERVGKVVFPTEGVEKIFFGVRFKKYGKGKKAN